MLFDLLVGDPSDNYAGVPGIGPKTAVALLDRFETLDGVYANLEEIKGAARKRNRGPDPRAAGDRAGGIKNDRN